MVSPCSDRIARVPPYSRITMLSTGTGLSPTMADLSTSFPFLPSGHWPGPRSLATTNGVSVDVLSSGYLDVSVPRVRLKPPMNSGVSYLHLITGNPKPRGLVSHIAVRTPRYKILEFQLSKVGFPIRKSSDRSLFAAPRGLSQRTTSFIACMRQGIH